jgi:hypothetical protein
MNGSLRRGIDVGNIVVASLKAVVNAELALERWTFAFQRGRLIGRCNYRSLS